MRKPETWSYLEEYVVKHEHTLFQKHFLFFKISSHVVFGVVDYEFDIHFAVEAYQNIPWKYELFEN